MKNVNGKLSTKLFVTVAGALWIMLANVSANAEDVELFLGSGNPGPQNQPNILLVLDDSGSMGSEVETQINYDPSTTYDGTCDPNRVYWVRHGFLGSQPEPPSSQECSSTNDWFAESSLVCAGALNSFASSDGGTYTDRMAQYEVDQGWRNRDSWEDISTHTQFVECEDDDGDHGQAAGDGKPYPQNGDENNKWTADVNDGIDWGHWWFGTGQYYTVYDGNYVNWINGAGASSTRIELMQEVAVNLVNSIGGVNVGLMSFNGSSGGLVRHEIADISGARSSLINAINDLDANGNTPLSETLYEAHQYFTGRNIVYGSGGDPDAVDPNDSSQYNSPMAGSCQKNHVVMLSDGAPTSDHEADDDIESLTDYAGDTFSDLTGNAQCDVEDYPEDFNQLHDGGVCLDDLSHYMHDGDMASDGGQQNITTHTVGFLVDLPTLEETAQRGGGDYYTANDTSSLTSALTAIVSNILETQSTFVAPAVSVNAFNQTRNLDDLYFSVFQPSTNAHWPGNLKKYRLRASDSTIVDANGNRAVNEDTGFFADTARSFWSDSVDGPSVQDGGAANEIPDPRTVYTNVNGPMLTDSGNHVLTGNSNLTDAVLGTDTSGGPTREEVIDFMNGLDAGDEDNDGVTDEPRRRMGDPLHSRPATVIYGPTNDDARIYFATNDGYLHSLDTETGAEQWAFVPEEFLLNQRKLLINGVTEDKIYGIDGDIVVQTVADRDGEIESGEKVYLFFGMRRGGDFYYGMDVSNPDQPEVLWRLDPSDLPGIGQSWSTPVPTRIDIAGVTQNDENSVLVIAGGYDPDQDSSATADSRGNSLYIVDSKTGDLLWHASDQGADLNLSASNGNNATMEYSIPADVRVVDINSDGFADRLYAADMGGQIWRFDVFNGNTLAEGVITGGAIAQLGVAGLSSPTSADARRFYYAPDAAFVSNAEQPFMHIGIGSGYRSHPNETSTDDRFYAIRDYAAFTWRSQAEFDAVQPRVDGDFVDISSDIDADVAAGAAGWKFDFTNTGEKVLAEAVTADGDVFFSTFRPGATGNGCNPSLGIHRQYRVSLLNGSPVTNLDGEVDEDGDGEPDDLTAEDRFTEDDGSPLSRTTIIFAEDSNSGDGDGSGTDGPTVIGCTETDCSDLGFDPSPRRTFWTQENVE